MRGGGTDAWPVVLFRRDERIHRTGGGAEVIVIQAGQSRVRDNIAVMFRRELCGVGAQQVMHAVPARARLVDQVRPREQGKHIPCLRGGHAGQRGDGVGIEVRPGVQADQPEHKRRRGREPTVGPGEHAADRGALIAARVKQVKPSLLIGQLGGELVEPTVRARRGEFGGHPRRERQPRALPGKRRRRGRFGIHAAADQRPQQRHGVLRRQHVEVEPPCPVPCDESHERITAGHHDQAGRAAGQQRPHLLHARGVVKHHEHPPPVEQAPIGGGALIGFLRDILLGQAKCPKEPRKRIPRQHRLVWVVATQVHVQLAIGKLADGPPSPADSERGLPHPGGARYHQDRYGRQLRGGPAYRIESARQELEFGQLIGPPGERGHVRGQLGRHRPFLPLAWPRQSGLAQHGLAQHSLARHSEVQARIGRQDPRMQRPQLRTRLDADLLDKDATGLGERRQGLGLPPAAVKRQHELAAEPLAQRIPAHKLGQLTRRLGVAAEREDDVDVLLDRGQPLLGESGPEDLRPRAGNAGQRGTLPQPQRRVERPGRARVVIRRPRFTRLDQPFREHLSVKLTGCKPQQVPKTAGRQHLARRTVRPSRLERRP